MNRKEPWSLVLGGGAARGLTYLGAYKRLEEHNYYPSEVVGNSAGSIIGAGIAMGMSFEEMYNIAKDIHWKKIVDLNLRWGLISGKKVDRIFDSVYGDTIFDQTKIPLKTIAVDLNTCQKVVMSSGKIKDGVKASTRIPLLFQPLHLGKQLLVDGGVMTNFPIEDATNKQVLGLYSLPTIQTPVASYKKNKRGKKRRKHFLGLTGQVTYRVYLSMLYSNVEKSKLLGEMQKKDVTILRVTPNKFKHYDFHKVNEMVEIGYKYMVEKFGE